MLPAFSRSSLALDTASWTVPRELGISANMACTNHCKMASMAPPPLPPFSPGLDDHAQPFSQVFLFVLAALNIMLIMIIVGYLIHRRFYAPQVDASDPVAKPVPVDPERLQKLQDMLATLPVLKANEASDVCVDCAICLVDYCDDDRTATMLPCGHVFHTDCFRKWTLHRPHIPNLGGSTVRQHASASPRRCPLTQTSDYSLTKATQSTLICAVPIMQTQASRL